MPAMPAMTAMTVAFHARHPLGSHAGNATTSTHPAWRSAKGLQLRPACVISACQAPNLMVPTLVAKVKLFPRNPRVRGGYGQVPGCNTTTSARPGSLHQQKTLFTALIALEWLL